MKFLVCASGCDRLRVMRCVQAGVIVAGYPSMKADPFWLVQRRLSSRNLEISTHSIGCGYELVSRAGFAPCGEDCLQATALALSSVMFQCECANRIDKSFDAVNSHLWAVREPCIGLGIEFTSLVGVTCLSDLEAWGGRKAQLPE